jgi:orotidine-5'-phosphate decarboxylase
MMSDRLEFLAVALDTSDWSEFEGWCRRFGPRAGVLKVGLEAFVRWGHKAVEEARATGARIFLDLKLHDIPNTVAGAVRSAADLGVSYLTVHSSGGRRMLEAAAQAAGDSLNVLAVTLLTHLDDADIAELDLPGDPRRRVERWANLAAESGCAGAVCSPLEVGRLRPALPRSFQLVTPGIRLDSEVGGDDQRRVATPRRALSEGADILVIGRPITRADDPETVLDKLAAAATR